MKALCGWLVGVAVWFCASFLSLRALRLLCERDSLGVCSPGDVAVTEAARDSCGAGRGCPCVRFEGSGARGAEECKYGCGEGAHFFVVTVFVSG